MVVVYGDTTLVRRDLLGQCHHRHLERLFYMIVRVAHSYDQRQDSSESYIPALTIVAEEMSLEGKANCGAVEECRGKRAVLTREENSQGFPDELKLG